MLRGLRHRMAAVFAISALAAGSAVTLAALPAAAEVPEIVSDPASYVNPFIGSTNLGNTYPGAVTPFGMLAWSPQTSGGDQFRTPAPGGYQYAAKRIRGLSLTHVSGVGCSGGNGDIPIMPHAGAITTSPSSDLTDAIYASTFSHANEQAAPGYYKVGLDSGAGIEVAASPRTGSGNLTFPAGKAANVLFRTSNSETGSDGATVHIDPATRTVTGSVTAGNFCGTLSTNNVKDYYTLYFTAHFDKPFAATGTWADDTLTPGSTDASGGTGWTAAGRPVPGKGSGGYVTFAPGTAKVGAKVAISYVSANNAEANLEAENPRARTFANVRAAANASWQKALRKIGVGGGSDDQKTTFYTALYHAMMEPTLNSDVTGEYLGGDRKTHSVAAPQLAQYGTFSGWDVYRAQVQLMAMIEPKIASDFAQSLYNYANQRGGEWDRWLLENGKTSVMSGDPSAAALAGMYAFGARDFDVRGALSSLVKAATEPTANDLSDDGCPVECVGQRPSLDRYLKLGYVPADDCHCWGAASETLEDAIADHGLSELAKATGDTATAGKFLARAGNWKNVFDPHAAADPGLPGNVRLRVTEITASAENAPGEGKTELLDGDLGTKWLAFDTKGWVRAKLDAPLAITKYSVTSANDVPERDPKDWVLEGSADGETWTAVDTRTGEQFADRGVTKVYEIADPRPYLYYRFNVTANNGAPIVQVAELQLSNPQTPTPPPADSPFEGWMRDRFADGTWAPGFTPSTERGFVEGSSARYTWMVYSDVVGLIRLMGGNAKAIERLDAFFKNPDGTFDFSASKSARYDPTNEPDIHAPYVYTFAGAAHKTQETVRAELDQLWTNTTGGIPGNDDAGTMSAKYVFAALGLYPYIPTRADLLLTAPLFPRAVVHVGTGKNLTINAPQASAANKYVQGLTVKGKASSKAWIPADLLQTGATLTYALGSAPDTSWGSAPGDLPPQSTAAQKVTANDVTATAGKRWRGPIASVTDPDTSAAALTATVDWGDGNTSAGTLTGSGGQYTVTAQHSYAAAGTYRVTVTATDPGGLTVVASSSTATVS
jgi:predicted alpha-1,2-mannosidase